jgi:hypothetical protein
MVGNGSSQERKGRGGEQGVHGWLWRRRRRGAMGEVHRRRGSVLLLRELLLAIGAHAWGRQWNRRERKEKKKGRRKRKRRKRMKFFQTWIFLEEKNKR